VIGEKIQASFGDAVLSTRSECGMEVVEVTRAAIPKVLAFLDSDPDLAFTMLLDVTAVDGLRLGWRDRFRVVYHLYSLARNERVRVVASVPESDPVVPSVFHQWKSADWLERETWDQYGIVFEGHPNLVRLLNHKEFVGHPLRKDYDIKKGQWLSEPDDLLDQLEKARQGILSEY
jgi:NADH/F420H2 dehydrogenase subunit C